MARTPKQVAKKTDDSGPNRNVNDHGSDEVLTKADISRKLKKFKRNKGAKSQKL